MLILLPRRTKKTLNGKRVPYHTALPTLFQPNMEDNSRRSILYETVKRKRQHQFRDENNTNRRQRTATSQFDTDAEDLAVESDVPCTVADIRDVEHDHSYSLAADDDHQCRRNELKEPEKTKSVGCQTEMSLFDLEEWEKEKRRLRCEIKNLQDRLSDKAKLKRELFMEDVLKNDDCVKFYTGIPTLGCFNMLTDLITPEAQKLKYWDKNKEKQMKYQTSPGNKPGPKRILTIKEEFVITLVRLRLGLMGRHLAHVFSVS